jgi:hypothetical protein
MTKWVAGMTILVLVVMGFKPVGEQWVGLGPWSGGINIESGGRFLNASQLYTASNFIWTVNGLQVRDGFQRFAAPVSADPINFLTIFRNQTGQKYLFSSDGSTLWCRRNLTETGTAIEYGRVTRGCANTYAGSTVVDIDTVSVANVRAMAGAGEGWVITVGDTSRIIDFVLCDTLLYVTVPFTTTMVRQAYDIHLQSIRINDAIPMVNNLWFYANTGKFYFNKTDSVVVTDPLTGDRWPLTTPYVKRYCWSTSNATLRFTASTLGSTNYAGQFLRLTTDPKSCVAHNPIPAGHHFYLPYPIQTSAGGIVYTRGAAFMPDSVGSGAAEYFTIEPLEYDSTTLTFVIVDSIQRLVQDSADWSCSESEATYLKVWMRSKPDSMDYGTGDHFFSPCLRDSTMGTPGSGSGSYNIVNHIRGSKFHTPNRQALKAASMTVKCPALSVSSISFKGAIYTSARALVDTTWTYQLPTDAAHTITGVTLTFPDPVELAGNTDYIFAIECDSVYNASYPYTFKILQNATHQYMWGQTLTYTGTFPATFEPTDSATHEMGASIAINWFDSSSTANRDAYTCYPIAGGYVTADSAILAACGPTGFHDHDTCTIAMFRMKRHLTNASAGINFAVKNNSNNTIFENRASNSDLIYYSEPNLPDSFLPAHVITIDPGNPCVTGGEQGGNTIIYTASGRFQLVYAGGGAYAKNRMDGSRGIIAKGSFVNVDGVHYGLARDGYWQSDGSAPVIISGAVESYFRDSLDYSKLDEIASGYEPTNDDIWITFNGITLVYHRPTQSWWRQSFAGTAYAYNGDIGISDSIAFVAAGGDSSTIFIQKGRQDDGVNLTASLQTGYMNFDAPETEKGIVDLRLGYRASDTSAGSIALYPALSIDGTLYNTSDTVAMTITTGAGDKWVRLPMGSLWGNEVGLGISVTNGSGLRWNYVRAKVMSGGER